MLDGGCRGIGAAVRIDGVQWKRRRSGESRSVGAKVKPQARPAPLNLLPLHPSPNCHPDEGLANARITAAIPPLISHLPGFASRCPPTECLVVPHALLGGESMGKRNRSGRFSRRRSGKARGRLANQRSTLVLIKTSRPSPPLNACYRDPGRFSGWLPGELSPLVLVDTEYSSLQSNNKYTLPPLSQRILGPFLTRSAPPPFSPVVNSKCRLIRLTLGNCWLFGSPIRIGADTSLVQPSIMSLRAHAPLQFPFIRYPV